MEKQFSRRKFLGLGAAAAAFTILPSGIYSPEPVKKAKKPNSRFGGVQVGAITYSWRSMPSTAEDILKYCLATGISSIELMGDVAENYAGLPKAPERPGRDAGDAEKARYAKESKEVAEAQKKWRLSASMDKYVELRKMFNNAGVKIHIVKFSPAAWSDPEINYSFVAAKALGTMGVREESLA
jgi:hypothetical protein